MIKNENVHDGDKNIKIRLVRYFQWRIYVGATRGRAPLVKKKKKKLISSVFLLENFVIAATKKKKKKITINFVFKKNVESGLEG
jgi:hypothetical protein